MTDHNQEPRVTEQAMPKHDAMVKRSEWDDAKAKRQSFNGWRQDYGDCDMKLYTEETVRAALTRQAAPEAEVPNYKGLYREACDDLAKIAEALGLESSENGWSGPIIAAIEDLQGQQAAPEAPTGYKWVPLEPTSSMIEAFHYEDGKSAQSKWRAMINAAPATQQAGAAVHFARLRNASDKAWTEHDAELASRLREQPEVYEVRTLYTNPAATQQAGAAVADNAEQIQWRNIQKVVREVAAFCFGSARQTGDVSLGAAYVAVINSLTAKDGLQVELEPLRASPAATTASASLDEQSNIPPPFAAPASQHDAVIRDAARYRWLCANNFDRQRTQVHTWVHTWEPHSQTGEPTEWKARIRGGALDRIIDEAMKGEQS